jgi:hypothetical protein
VEQHREGCSAGKHFSLQVLKGQDRRDEAWRERIGDGPLHRVQCGVQVSPVDAMETSRCGWREQLSVDWICLILNFLF